MSDADLLIGNYKLLNCIASGQQSQVWEVVEIATSDRFAMKLLKPDAMKDPEQKKSLKHEANVAKSLDHPNIIKFHNLTMNKDVAYILMELFRAPNLKGQIQGDLLSLQMRLKRLIELTSMALAHMHEKGWIHKDIKPDNILFSKGSELRLIDFSLAGRISSGFSSFFGGGKSKMIQGTRTYMAPEQIRRKQLSPQTDIYNFGITIFEMLTGRPPFQAPSPNELLRRHLNMAPPNPSSYNPNVTPEMDRMVLRMLAKKPANRQKTMNEIMAEFRSINIFREAIEADVEKSVDLKIEQERVLGERRDSRSDALRSDARRQDVESRSGATPAPPTKSPPLAPPGKAAAASVPPQPATPPARPPAGGPALPPARGAQPAVPPRPPAAAPPVPGARPPAAMPPAPAAGLPPRPAAAPPKPAAPPPRPGAAPPMPAPQRPAPQPAGGQPAAARPPAGQPAPATRPPANRAPAARPVPPAPRPAANQPPPAATPDEMPLLDEFKIL